ncbi:MAG: lysylphosphatidylglycerol synthase domain-containing protein, partial [Desulfobacterales bacterium]|nr:lysylphosphatidylglycerol synthase domain-containing protein [Desulfobacterales bacterium]
MPLSHLENTVQKHAEVSIRSIPDQTEQPVVSKNGIKKLGICRLFCGGLIFTGLTVGIFWYQFSKIPVGSRPPLGEQLQWNYLFWLLLFLPIETCAAGLRIRVISRVLQPGVNLWTCLKAEWVNLGLAMLTPSQTGGGIGQVYILCRGGMQFGTALTVSLISFLGSMVILLFVGLYSLLISGVGQLTAFFQGAFLIFFLVFGGLIAAACWPGCVRWVVLQISSTVSKLGQRSRSHDSLPLSKAPPLSRPVEYLQTLFTKIIDLCHLHQNNIRLFFRLNHSGFLWVCLLSLVFMLSRSMIAFLCLRFLGV